MYQVKKDRTTYANCILAMVILLICALLGPQVLFVVQDNHIQGEIFTGERNQMDMTLLNVGYPKELRDRLISFAQGRQSEKTYFATATDCVVDVEYYDVVDGILDKEWFTFLCDMGILFWDYNEVLKMGYTIEECKRYVIYDEAFENGVAFVAWYFDMTISDLVQLKLLADAEDGTVYQLQVTTKDGKAWSYYGYQEMDYLYTEIANNLVLYWYLYYDAGESDEMSYKDYLESIGYDVTYADEKKIVTDSKQMVTDKKKEQIIQAYDMLMLEDQYALLKKTLPYNENQLQWQMQVYKGDEVADTVISMGIAEVAEMVPEFALD